MNILLEKYAGFWRRALASILDELATTIPSYFLGQGALYIIFYLFVKETPFEKAFTEGTKTYIGIIAGFFISIPYEVGFHYYKGWTPGKRLVRVIVRDYKTKGPLTLKQCFIRYLGQFVSMLPLGAGYLMAAWDPEKRALHDLIAGTVSYTFRDNPLANLDEKLKEVTGEITAPVIDRSREPKL